MKSFKKNNPLENLDNTPKQPEPAKTEGPTTRLFEDSTLIPEPELKKAEEQEDVVTPEIKKGTRKAPKEKGEKKHLLLDITGYQEYISLMSQYASKTSGKYVSMTQYILKLIEADKQEHKEIYDKLSQIEKMKNDII